MALQSRNELIFVPYAFLVELAYALSWTRERADRSGTSTTCGLAIAVAAAAAGNASSVKCTLLSALSLEVEMEASRCLRCVRNCCVGDDDRDDEDAVVARDDFDLPR
jgi:hypothetical protein